MLSGRIFGRAVLLFALTMTWVGGSEVFGPPDANAARCYTSDGITSCIGDCCGAGATTCWAGPCPKQEEPRAEEAAALTD
jgi:hypothetical protein